MWSVIGILGLVAVVAFAILPLSASEQIGKQMENNFIEKHTKWKDIDFTTAVLGETHFISSVNEKPYPALEKYKLRIYSIQDIIFAIGSNREEADNELRRKPLEVFARESVEQYEQAFIFRSTDGGETFIKTELDHGEVQDVFEFGDLYACVLENDTYKKRYYVSKDQGATWWQTKITFDPDNLWRIDGDRWLVRIGNKFFYTSDYMKTTKPVSEALQGFLERYANHFNSSFGQDIAYMSHKLFFYDDKRKQLIYFDLDDNREKSYDLDVPEGKVIDGIGVETQNGEPARLYLKLFDDVPDTSEETKKYRRTQQSIWYPFTHEHVQLPKKLPFTIFFRVKENYIGGIKRHGDAVWGIPVHVYTLDHGKHWNYEILADYSLQRSETYIDGTFWFIAMKGKGKYLVKGKLD